MYQLYVNVLFVKVLMVLVIFSLGLILGYVVRRSVHEVYIAPQRCPISIMYEVRSMFSSILFYIQNKAMFLTD